MNNAHKFDRNCPLLSQLIVSGYLVVSKESMAENKQKFESLGKVFRTTDVKIKMDEKMAVYNPAAIPFHTDSPEAEFISWTCLDAGESDRTSMYLIDGIAEIEKLPAIAKAEIGLATIKYSTEENPELSYFPVISDRGFCYNRWHLDTSKMSSDLAKTLTQLFSGNSQSIHHIQLQVGDTLVVDNLRMLHGRPSISSASSRHLKRKWIKACAGTEA